MPACGSAAAVGEAAALVIDVGLGVVVDVSLPPPPAAGEGLGEAVGEEAVGLAVGEAVGDAVAVGDGLAAAIVKDKASQDRFAAGAGFGAVGATGSRRNS